VKAKYLRFAWHGERPPVGLQRVDVQPMESAWERAHSWSRLRPKAGERPGEYIYEVSDSLPVDRMRVEMPQPNTVAPALLHVWDEEREEWRQVSNFVAYRLGEGDKEASSPEIKIYAHGTRWMLKVDGALGNGEPILHAGWMPHRLVFNAQGTAPFTVAFGNPNIEPAGLEVESLVPGYGSEQRNAPLPAVLQNVQPNAQHATGWLANLDLKRAALWSALVVAVSLIAFMAWRLMRQMTQR